MKLNSNSNFNFFIGKQVRIAKLFPEELWKYFFNEKSPRSIRVTDQKFWPWVCHVWDVDWLPPCTKVVASWKLGWSKVGSLRGPLDQSLGFCTLMFLPYVHYFTCFKIFYNFIDFIQHSQTFPRPKDVYYFKFASLRMSWTFHSLFVLTLLDNFITPISM